MTFFELAKNMFGKSKLVINQELYRKQMMEHLNFINNKHK